MMQPRISARWALAAGAALLCAQAGAATSTATRPQLSSSEQGSYTKSTFLNGWSPAISVGSANYVVSPSGPYKTVQSAVNAAIKAGGSSRKTIQVKNGTYTGLVFVPTGVPLTIVGDSATGVVLQMGAYSTQSGSSFKSMVPNDSDFTSGAPSAVASYYSGCGGKSEIGTSCTGVVVSDANDLLVKNLTIKNTYNESANTSAHQAQAFHKRNGDKVILDGVRLIGNQDTLGVFGTGKRAYIRNSYVEGDTDFIFGDGTAVFEGCQIHFTTARKASSTITAPSSPMGNKGFLFIGGSFTSPGAPGSIYLGRQWPQHGSTSGQTILREVNLGAHIHPTAPWRDWSSDQKATYGSAGNRRLAEYNNTGPGAAR